MKTALQAVGGLFLWIGVMIAIAFVAAFIINGGVNVAVWVLPIINNVYAIAVVFDIAILLPLALFKKTRGFAGTGLYLSSYIFGLNLWIFSFLMAYAFWGVVGVFLGIIFLGVGVVPVAALAFLVHGLWIPLFELLLGVVVVFVTRWLGQWIWYKDNMRKFADSVEDGTISLDYQEEVIQEDL